LNHPPIINGLSFLKITSVFELLELRPNLVALYYPKTRFCSVFDKGRDNRDAGDAIGVAVFGPYERRALLRKAMKHSDLMKQLPRGPLRVNVAMN